MSDTRIIGHGDRTRFLLGPLGTRATAEVLVSVNGVDTWREAQWDDEVVSTLCSRRGMEETRAPVLKPVLRAGEVLRETADGRMFIETVAVGGGA